MNTIKEKKVKGYIGTRPVTFLEEMCCEEPHLSGPGDYHGSCCSHCGLVWTCHTWKHVPRKGGK